MLRKFFAFTLALLLAATIPLGALAEEYDLVNGSITVEAKEDGQYVSQVGVADNVKQTTDTVIKQTDSDTTSTTNTITIKATGEVTNEDGTKEKVTAEVTISDVNIDVSKEGKAAISSEGDGNVTIELDGDNTAKSGEDHAGVEKNNDGNLTIADADADGSLNATGGSYGAGIGGGYEQDVSDITIESSDITATGGRGGAGIGGGNAGDASNITIAGGEIDAVGGKQAAGIGGGYNGDGSYITIEDGTVKAVGGASDNNRDGGAGIGGGAFKRGFNITINGGDVEAEGGCDGAGIGGGRSYGSGGEGFDITITDGNVIAKGGESAAGIGGGLGSDGFNITISGGNVEVEGGKWAAGIGSGSDTTGKGSNITIEGDAQVKVSGGEGAPAIGGTGNGEVVPKTDGLTTSSIAYYAPGADKETTAPEKLLHKASDGTAVTHDGVTLKSSTEATCTKNATVTYQCSCGEEVTMELVGTALGHALGDYTPNNDATCMKDGTKTAYCTHTGCDYSVTVDDEGTRDPNKHSFSYTPNNNATCTADGTETARCAYGCGTTDTREIPDSKLPHEFGDYVYQDDATCTADGTEIAQCEHCDATDERTAAGTALGHSFTHYVSNNDATYDSDGTQTAECDHGCGATNTIPAPGTRIPLYRVVDAAGKNLPSRKSKDGTILTITAEQDYATLTGTLDGIRTLQQRGITTIVFVTNHATSTFDLSTLTGTGTYALTHNGEAVTFTLNNQDVSNILK